MIHIDVRFLMEHIEQLHNISYHLLRESDEVSRSMKENQIFLDDTGLRGELIQIYARMLTIAKQLRDVQNCTERIEQEYERTERRIDDEIEEAQIRNRYHKSVAKFQNIGWVEGRLHQLIYEKTPFE